MPEKHVAVIGDKNSDWKCFLEEFLDDTLSRLHCFENPATAGPFFSKVTPDIVFIQSEMMTLAFAQKLKALRASSPDLKIFGTGKNHTNSPLIVFDKIFHFPPCMSEFCRELVNSLPMPENVRLLVIDDEPDVGTMVKDFFEGRTYPKFDIECADNGQKGLEAIHRRMPDIVLLDIKMPVKDGREVYREIVSRKWKISVVVFFDAILGNEVEEIHKIGRPAIVEKGAKQSSPAELLSLIKKQIFFA